MSYLWSRIHPSKAEAVIHIWMGEQLRLSLLFPYPKHTHRVKAKPILIGYIPALGTEGKRGYGLSACCVGFNCRCFAYMVQSAEDAS